MCRFFNKKVYPFFKKNVLRNILQRALLGVKFPKFSTRLALLGAAPRLRSAGKETIKPAPTFGDPASP